METPIETPQVETNELSLIQQLVNASQGITPAPVATTPAVEIIETPAVETPVVEPTLLPDVDYDKYISEQTEGRFKSVEELKNFDPSKVDPISVLEDDNAKALLQAIRNGELDKVKDYVDSQLTDYAKLSGEEIMERKIKADYPHLTKQQIADEVESRYKSRLFPLTEDDKEVMNPRQIADHEAQMERERADGERKLLMDAEKARIELESQKINIKLPEYKAPEPVVQPEEIQQVELTPEQVEQGKNYAKASVEKVAQQKFSIKVGDEGQVIESSFSLSSEDKSALADYLYNRGVTPVDEARFSKDGNFDAEAWAKAGLLALYGDKIIAASMTETRNKSLEQFVAQDLKGIPLNPQTVADTSASVDVNTQILQQILANKQKNF